MPVRNQMMNPMPSCAVMYGPGEVRCEFVFVEESDALRVIENHNLDASETREFFLFTDDWSEVWSRPK